MKDLPRLPIAHLPTPVESLPRLSKVLGGPQILVKRDDQTGLAFGGNKIRKLEYLLGDAQAGGARMLITTGAIQSNHCRQTAAFAARAGLDCTLVLVGEEPTHPEGNLFLDRLLGAEVVWAEKEKRDHTLQEVFQQKQAEGSKPYLVPYGGSNPVGASAYAYAIRELLAQNVHPDWVVFASSSGGTQAGMLVGARLFGFEGRVLGTSVDEPAEVLRERVAALATDTTSFLGEPHSFGPADVNVNADYLGEGYAVMGDPEREAIRLFARHEGLLLDPVYTGRAAAALIDLIRQDFFNPDDTILFWHTGGTPTLFVDKYRLEILK